MTIIALMSPVIEISISLTSKAVINPAGQGNLILSVAIYVEHNELLGSLPLESLNSKAIL